MLTPYLPFPTNSGGQIRSNNLIKHLSKQHEITLCSLIKNNEDKKFIDKLKPYCKNIYVFKRPEKPFTISNILKTGFSFDPLLVIRNFSPSEKKALPKIIEEGDFDIIHAETFYVYPHIPKTKIPNLKIAEAGYYLETPSLSFSSWFAIHRSIVAFLNRQLAPTLKAGSLPAVACL